LWNARTARESSRITRIGAASTVNVMKSPGFGISNANPANSQPPYQIRSSSRV
jgi:hypothetical protein